MYIIYIYIYIRQRSTGSGVQPFLVGYWNMFPPKTHEWQWKTNHLKMYLLLKMMIFHCHVSFCFANVGKYTSPMDCMGLELVEIWTSLLSGRLLPLHLRASRLFHETRSGRASPLFECLKIVNFCRRSYRYPLHGYDTTNTFSFRLLKESIIRSI